MICWLRNQLITNYFTVAKELCTGSSIMPQKKNVDIAELLRSKVHIVTGNYIQMTGISNNLESGYNRDLQDTKKPLFESLEVTKDSLEVAKILLEGITPNIEVLEKAMSNEIFSTHKALALVKDGVPFREAYKRIQNSEFRIQNYSDLKNILKESMHLGGTGNLGIQNSEFRIQNEKKKLLKEKEKFEGAIEDLFKSI